MVFHCAFIQSGSVIYFTRKYKVTMLVYPINGQQKLNVHHHGQRIMGGKHANQMT